MCWQKWPTGDSNPGPLDIKSRALPTEPYMIFYKESNELKS